MPPRERQKLERRTPAALGNVADRYYRAGNLEGMGRINQELQDRLQNMPTLQPGTGFRQLGRPEEGLEGVGPGSFWNVRADQPWQDSGVMLAMANSPAINKMKNIYNQVDPFFPNVNPGDQQIGYDFDKNLWGGTLGFGGGYDIDDEDYNAYINWGTNW